MEVLLKTKNRQYEYKRLLGNEYVDSGYLYVKDNGITYRVNTVTEQFKELLERNDLPKIRLHNLRHTFASLLYEAGVGLKAISEALGHSEIGNTNKIYTHTFEKSHKETVSVKSEVLKSIE